MYLRKLFALLLCLAVPAVTGCTGPANKYQTQFYDVFDTVTTLTGYAGSEREFQKHAQSVHGELLRLHRLFDIYNAYDGINNLKTVNDNAGISPVTVDPAILDLLELSKAACAETSGAVNAALGPVLRIWHDYRAAGLADPASAALPSVDELREAARYTSIDRVVIDRENSTVFLPDSRMSLDVGAMAKGFAAQAAADLARENGFVSGTLNAGGNVCAIGSPQDGRQNWSVGVQSPEGAPEPYDVIYISGCAAVTSGSYQRYYTVDSADYHHIIDPQTLYPATGVRAVTVVHPNSAAADILSTAAFILPYEQGRELVERSGGQAVWILADGSERCTVGYEAISRNHGAAAG